MPQLRVQQAGDKTRQHTRDHGGQQRQPRRPTGDDEHDRTRAAGGERSVDRQIGHVEHAVGDVYAHGHNAPDKALGHAAGHRVDQGIRQDSSRNKTSELFGNDAPTSGRVSLSSLFIRLSDSGIFCL